MSSASQLLFSRTQGRLFSASLEWLPTILFLSGEEGFWYDPTDQSTLYQDAGETTPVTAINDPIGSVTNKISGVSSSSLSYIPYTGFEGTSGEPVWTGSSIECDLSGGGAGDDFRYLRAFDIFGNVDIDATDFTIYFVISVPSGEQEKRPFKIAESYDSNPQIGLSQDGSIRFNNGFISGGTWPEDVLSLFEIEKSGDNYTVLLNGSPYLSGTHDLGSFVKDDLKLGNDPTPGFPTRPIIGESVGINRLLSSGEKSLLRDYMIEKAGI